MKSKKKNLILIAGALLLFTALLGAVALVQKTQETRRGAVEEIGEGKIQPVIRAYVFGTSQEAAILQPGQNYHLRFYLNSINEVFSARVVGAEISFDSAVFRIDSLACSNDFPRAVAREANSSGLIRLTCFRDASFSELLIPAEGAGVLFGIASVFVKEDAPSGATNLEFLRTNIPNGADPAVPDLAVEGSKFYLDITDTPVPIRVNIAEGQIVPDPAVIGQGVTYNVGEHTYSWKTSIRYFYGDQPVMDGEDNVCCAGFCDNGETASNCQIQEVGSREEEKLWFWANLTRTIDSVRYLCDWEGNWKKWESDAWVNGSPGTDYVCENESLKMVAVIEPGAPTPTPTPTDEPLEPTATPTLVPPSPTPTTGAVCAKGPDGDLNCNGWIDGTDLSTLLGAWSPGGPVPTPKPGYHLADITGSNGVPDGKVDGTDLSRLLSNWNPPSN